MKTILQKDLWSISSFLENKQYRFNKKSILTHLPESFIDEAIEVISSWKSYYPTPLIKLNKLNDELELKNIYYKDEDKRFDLKSFKALGGAFAVYKIASEKKNITVSTATAGNHGIRKLLETFPPASAARTSLSISTNQASSAS